MSLVSFATLGSMGVGSVVETRALCWASDTRLAAAGAAAASKLEFRGLYGH